MIKVLFRPIRYMFKPNWYGVRRLWTVYGCRDQIINYKWIIDIGCITILNKEVQA